MFWKEEAGQAGIETLMIIAGAIVAATVVGFFLKSSVSNPNSGLNQQIEQERNELIDNLR